MSGIAVVEFVSLDGVVQAPGGRREDPDGFAHGGWTAPWFPSHAAGMVEVMEAAGGFLFGRRTYEIFASHWPRVTDPADRLAAALNGKPKFVASTTLATAGWPGTTILTDDVPARAAAEARGLDGHLVVLGSSVLAHALTGAEVVDRYQLWLHPVVLGSGKRLFDQHAGSPLTLRLAGSRVSDDGLVVLDYDRTARPPVAA